jgi:hypothetical protein
MMRTTAVLLLLLAASHRAAAQPRADDGAGPLGLIVDERSAARAANGALDEARIPGARAWRALDPAVAARRTALEADRDAAEANAPGAAAVVIAPLAGDPKSPPRVDSGDPDPDRLHSPPPAP